MPDTDGRRERDLPRCEDVAADLAEAVAVALPNARRTTASKSAKGAYRVHGSRGR